MAQGLPIKFQEVLQLQQLGLTPQSFVFANCTLQSDRFICIRDQSKEPQQVVIVDMRNPANPVRFPVNADSAVMNPEEEILALKAGNVLQIFHIIEKRKVKDYTMQEAVVYWRWISSATLALVTENAVYHWSLEGSHPPTKVFDRLPNMAGTQIINYRADRTQKWLLLVGISQKEGRVVGSMQLYSVDKNLSQPIEGHAGGFTRYVAKEGQPPIILFSFVNRSASASKLYVLEVGSEGNFERVVTDFFFPREAAGDFPVALETSEKFGAVYMVTKLGYFYLFDLTTGKTMYMNRISAQTIFTTCRHKDTNGFLGINTNGQVLLVTVDENNLVPYIVKTLNDISLAITVASKNNLPGADELFMRQFNQSFASGDYQTAAKAAVEAPNGMLRTTSTVQRFKSAPQVPGQPSPLLQYFSLLLEKGALNTIESLELARPVLQQGRKELLERWFDEDKLGCSEELGDLIHQADTNLALKVYFRAEVKNKVIACFAETGQFDKIVAYAKKVGYVPDWAYLLQNILAVNPAGAAQFAQLLLNDEAGPQVDVNLVIDAFLARGLVAEITAILLETLKNDKPEDGPLQTRLLEFNLVNGQINLVEGIFKNQLFHHYDRRFVAKLLEKAGMFQRALEHYSDLSDIKRVLMHAHTMAPDFIVAYFGTLSNEDALDCLRELMRANRQQNLQNVVNVAIKYADKLTPAALIQLLENFQAYDGIYLFLHEIVNYSEDPDVHFKYIEAACRVGQLAEVERVVRESNVYDPVRVKEFLKENKLQDQVPLIIVCDRHGFVDDLTKHLYHHNLLRYLEVYIQKVNPNQAPTVVGSLLDVDCNEDYIRNLIKMLGKDVPVSELIEACEQRNRLKILLPWLEELVHAGSVEPAAHNALAKIYIDMNRDAERFLLSNQYYDSREVGKFCEGRDPHLACVVYRRGLCDKELIDVTNRNELWRNQARYLLERQSEDLWLTVLDESNPHRRNIIDQVVQSSIPECNNPDEVSCTVQSFMHAGLPLELIGLLEKIVLETNSRFGNNRNLQNLLILTAVKANTAKVMEYINRLDNFDAPEIASIAIGAELYEEAFVVYKKFKHNSQAIQVLIDHLNDVHRANDFANLVNEPEVYSKLARAQLDRKLVKEAIDSFIKASDHQYYLDVIRAAEESDLYQDLTRFLLMCRKMGKDPHVETELAWAYAKTNSLRELNEFISTPNCAQIQVVGDRCFNAGLYQAAKLLFNNISNFARLASTLVKLEDYSAGVEAARKANNIRTWKEVCAACVDAQQFRLAQICGLHIIIHSEELDELIRYYEERGHFEELMGLIEAGLNLERAHIGMFTELAILFSKYKPEKLMDHLRLFYNRMNISKVLKICEKNHQWPELTFLYIHYKEPDNAALTMINHSVEAWEHILFKEILPKVTSVEILYRSIQFYFEEHPTLVNDLLTVVVGRVDHSRVVSLARGPGPNDYLPLIKPYLLSVQPENTKAVNNSVNQLYIEEEDYENLRTSIDTFSNFDNLELAQTLERNNSVEFRRIAAYLYKKNKRWEQSIELSKRDHLWKDAIDCAAESANSKLIEQLLRFFVAEGRKDCFAACTYTCYNYIRPDIVLEVAWTNGMIDFAMPFLIQTMKDFSSKLADLDSKVNPPPPQMDPNAVPGSPQNFGQPVDGFYPPGQVPFGGQGFSGGYAPY